MEESSKRLQQSSCKRKVGMCVSFSRTSVFGMVPFKSVDKSAVALRPMPRFGRSYTWQASDWAPDGGQMVATKPSKAQSGEERWPSCCILRIRYSFGCSPNLPNRQWCGFPERPMRLQSSSSCARGLVPGLAWADCFRMVSSGCGFAQLFAVHQIDPCRKCLLVLALVLVFRECGVRVRLLGVRVRAWVSG